MSMQTNPAVVTIRIVSPLCLLRIGRITVRFVNDGPACLIGTQPVLQGSASVRRMQKSRIMNQNKAVETKGLFWFINYVRKNCEQVRPLPHRGSGIQRRLADLARHSQLVFGPNATRS
jgi:hypothetical protein